MFGMSVPSVEIANPFQESGSRAERGDENNEPRLTRIGYSPELKPSTNDTRSAAGSRGVHASRDCRITKRSGELHDMGKIDAEDKGGLAIICLTRLKTRSRGSGAIFAPDLLS